MTVETMTRKQKPSQPAASSVPPGWIGVDFDGTLACYHGWTGLTELGAPVPAMVKRVKRWLAEGYKVKVFTARVSNFDPGDNSVARAAIRRWCGEHIGQALEVVCCKDFAMLELWDDRAIQVIPNTGEPVGKSTRGLD